MLPITSAASANTRPNPHAANSAAGDRADLVCTHPHRRQTVWLMVVLTSALLSAVSGCSSKRTLSLEGVWTDKDRHTARFLFRRDGTGRLVGGQVELSFKAAGRECTGKLLDKVLVIEPADSLRFGDGHYLSNPKTLVWFAPTR